MHERIGEHPAWQWPLVGSVHADTLLTTWIVMGLSILFFWWLGSSYKSPQANKIQATFEGIIDYLGDISTGTMGKKGEQYVPVFVGLFIFIFLLNQVGFFPFKRLGLPFGGSPTADLNTTAAFALVVFFSIWFIAIRQSGIKAFAHLFKPYVPLVVINVIEELARPIVLALRLFFNVFVGELLLFVVATIVSQNVSIGPINLSALASVVPFFLQFFNFFIGTLQAFVFTLLTIVYLSLATAEEGH